MEGTATQARLGGVHEVSHFDSAQCERVPMVRRFVPRFVLSGVKDGRQAAFGGSRRCRSSEACDSWLSCSMVPPLAYGRGSDSSGRPALSGIRLGQAHEAEDSGCAVVVVRRGAGRSFAPKEPAIKHAGALPIVRDRGVEGSKLTDAARATRE